MDAARTGAEKARRCFGRIVRYARDSIQTAAARIAGNPSGGDKAPPRV